MQGNLTQDGKLPIMVGVTGHRDLVPEDIPQIREQVIKTLQEIRERCGDGAPVIMLNAFAEGADLLCADVAFEMGMDVYALLPCPPDRYEKSFEDKTMIPKLREGLKRAKRVIIASDLEENKEGIRQVKFIGDIDYEYRQLGINMASNSHILLALWNGAAPVDKFGCGAADIVKFALEQNYFCGDNFYRPSLSNDCAVAWIPIRRMKDMKAGAGETACAPQQRVWLSGKFATADKEGSCASDYTRTETMPPFLEEVIDKTCAYNSEGVDTVPSKPKLWKDVEELDAYHKALRAHYIKADELSYSVNQKKYNILLFSIALLGTLIALFFTLYDDASIRWMIVLCTVSLCVLLLITNYGRRKKVLEKYVGCRAFAEALRTQFYTSMIVQEGYPEVVCDLYSCTQKANFSWISKAIKAIGVLNGRSAMNVDRSEVIDVWLGNNSKPTGQLRYHSGSIHKNRRKAQLNANVSSAIRVITVLIYFLIFAFEVVSAILAASGETWFWDGNMVGEFPWRSFGVILMGTAAAGSLLFSEYLGKLSYDRKADDNKNMISFYFFACERWKDVSAMNNEAAVKKFVLEIAREEIVENGIWCSYVIDNNLEVEI